MGWGMGMSKSTRILILLGIDTAFFLLELIVGMFVEVLYGKLLSYLAKTTFF